MEQFKTIFKSFKKRNDEEILSTVYCFNIKLFNKFSIYIKKIGDGYYLEIPISRYVEYDDDDDREFCNTYQKSYIHNMKVDVNDDASIEKLYYDLKQIISNLKYSKLIGDIYDSSEINNKYNNVLMEKEMFPEYYKDIICCVCLEETILKLPKCNHILCIDCHLSIVEQIEDEDEEPVCPLCRQEIPRIYN
jgi:hypothetical protein